MKKKLCQPDVLPDVSPFRRKVYLALMSVPAGKVTTYGALAAAVGCRSPRTVGQALRHNPFAPQVPCHRVIASDGSLGGFQGHAAGGPLKKKLSLLKSEGVIFKDNKLADPGRIFCFQPRTG